MNLTLKEVPVGLKTYVYTGERITALGVVVEVSY